MISRALFCVLFVLLNIAAASAESSSLSLPPAGTAKGKHIVLLSGDEEYRSEEALPMLAKILSQRHGFKCTVLFAQDADGCRAVHKWHEHVRNDHFDIIFV